MTLHRFLNQSELKTKPAKIRSYLYMNVFTFVGVEETCLADNL